MSITLERLADITGWKFVSPAGRRFELNSVELLGRDNKETALHTLYVGSWTEIAKHLSEDRCFCPLDWEGDPPAGEAGLLFPEGDREPEKLREKLSGILEEQCYVDDCSLRLYQALVSGKGLQHILDVALEIFDNPIFVVDHSFKLLAYALPEGTTTEQVLVIVEKGYYPSDYILGTVAKDTEIHSKIYFSEYPEIVQDSYSPSPFMSFKIDGSEAPIGFSSLLEDHRPFRSTDPQLFYVLCQILGNEYRSSASAEKAFAHKYEYFIAEILNRTLRPEQVPERLSQFDLHLKKHLYLLVAVYSNETEFKRFYFEFVRGYLEAIIPGAMCSVYHNNLVVLINSQTEINFRGPLFQDVGECLRTNHLVAGVSNVFKELADMPEAYRQALLAVQCRQHKPSPSRLYHFCDYGWYHMFDLAHEDGLLDKLPAPSYLKMLRYDEVHGTNYAESLRVYLDCGYNASKTAAVLNVHRNTVDYRINKAKEIFDLDLNDGDTLFQMALSYRISEYYQSRGKQDTPDQ